MDLDQNIAMQRPHTKGFLTTPVGRFFERQTYQRLAASTGGLIFIATLYFWSAPKGHGITSNGNEPLGFLDALYFTVVTFTTVGYGDITPLGFGRVVAITLALSGLGAVALIIGKLASERQYTMLLLLHTSDCQRRISDFSSQIAVLSGQLKMAVSVQDLNAISTNVRAACALRGAVNNYVVFHLNQSRLAEFGNESALGKLCRDVMGLQRECAGVFRAPELPSGDGQRSLLLVEQLLRLVRIIEYHGKSLEYSDSVKTDGEIRLIAGMEQELTELMKWSRSHVSEWIVRRVFESAPKAPVAGWPKGTHKTLAKQLNISNNLAQKCVSVLIARAWITV